MKISYDGLFDKCATFMCGDIEENTPVKVSENCTVAAAASDEEFCGVVAGVRNGMCAVKMNGAVTLGYTGNAPALGFTQLSADGNGGVKSASSGIMRLVVEVDEQAATVTFIM